MTVSLSLQGQTLGLSTPPTYQVAFGTRVVRLFGKVEFNVDYHNLCLHPAQRENVEGLLCAWAASDDLVAEAHQLTELEGCYVIIVEDKGQATYLYTSNDPNFLLYYAPRNDEVFLSTDWIKVLQWLGKVEVSEEDMTRFMLREWTDNSHTLFRDLYLLRPYALYRINPGNLSIIKHTFPGLHTIEQVGLRQYETCDYVRALGAYGKHFDCFSLAFSGGTDSRILAYAYQDRLKQLLTIMYPPPFVSQGRYQSGQASQKLAQAQKLEYTPVLVNWSDTATLEPYIKHFAAANPFSVHLNAHYYHLATHIDKGCDVLLLGTFSDIIWSWGQCQIYFSEKQSHSTSSHSLRGEFDRMIARGTPRLMAHYAVNRLAVRWAMMKSFDKPRFRSLINYYEPFGSQFDELWRYPYKLFSLRRYVEWSPAAETTLWNRVSGYVGKRVILPFISPLALHVSSQIPRQNFFDLKHQLRGIYGEYDASMMDTGPQYSDDQRRRPYSADVFNQPGVMEWNQQFVDTHSRKPFKLDNLPQNRARAGFYHLHLNHLFRFVEEQMAAAVR